MNGDVLSLLKKIAPVFQPPNHIEYFLLETKLNHKIKFPWPNDIKNIPFSAKILPKIYKIFGTNFGKKASIIYDNNQYIFITTQPNADAPLNTWCE